MTSRRRGIRRTLVTTALASGLVVAAAAAPAAAQDGFVAPDYPSARCTPMLKGSTLGAGLAPQQWNAAAGLPLAIAGTPAAQRIVIGEMSSVPDQSAVDALLTQCGLPTRTIINPTSGNRELDQPTIEAVMDAAIVSAAAPPGSSLYLANAKTMAGVLSVAARACGLTPTEGMGTAPAFVRSADFPAGGCIVTVSYSKPETQTKAAEMAQVGALVEAITDQGVIVVFSSGDTGSGGCISDVGGGGLSTMGRPVLLKVIDYAVTSGEATFTVSGSAAGWQEHEYVYLTGFSNNGLQGMFATNPSATGLSANQFSVTVNPQRQYRPFGGAKRTGTASFNFGPPVANWPTTIPSALAVGGTQWAANSATVPSGWSLPYRGGQQLSSATWLDSADEDGPCANGYPQGSGTVVANEGGGGGVSGVWSMPAYQSGPVTANYAGTASGRSVPDVSALAGWPAYSLVEPGESVTDAAVASGTATVGVWAQGIRPGYTVTVSGLTGRYRVLNGTFKVLTVDSDQLKITYRVNNRAVDLPRAKQSAGLVTVVCRGPRPCTAKNFPWSPNGGTSAAAPLVAVGLANVNAALSAQGLPIITSGGPLDVHSVIYGGDYAAAITDVTQGSNDITGIGAWDALPGYDRATGMGVIDFGTLAALISAKLSAPRSRSVVQPHAPVDLWGLPRVLR